MFYMNIRLETSKARGINNFQGAEISAFERNWAAKIPYDYPNARSRTTPSPKYNCHGMTFASRRTKILTTTQIQMILDDDNYQEVDLREALPGDIAVYYSEDGDANHSGIVVEYDQGLLVPIIFSKWGNAGEYIHGLRDCPSIYGPIVKFYRCRL